ncbi:MAG: response regulator transcription factor [Niastella sp.]|jgi:DNA-binding NarL/FixJ family response regulator|uniref:response regulator n=1 Tax=Niastella sp. TaxID=1869183 RepID=UPI00389A7718
MENVQSVTIAIVDDHMMLRQAIHLRLSLLGYKVVLEAENGKDLLDRLPEMNTEPDICLLDINMPVMNGFETAIELKKRWPYIKVVFFTMHNSKAYVVKAYQIGVHGFLLKDASTEELKQALSDVMKS